MDSMDKALDRAKKAELSLKRSIDSFNRLGKASERFENAKLSLMVARLELTGLELRHGSS